MDQADIRTANGESWRVVRTIRNWFESSGGKVGTVDWSNQAKIKLINFQ